MAAGQKRNRALVREAAPALEAFKQQAAQQVGIQIPPDGYWGDIPARLNGAVGGQMVRQMIQFAEQQLAGNPAAAQQFAAVTPTRQQRP